MSTIYSLQSTDLISQTFDDINDNFTNLNTDKADKVVWLQQFASTTSAQLDWVISDSIWEWLLLFWNALDFYKYSIVTSVASGNLTVALKNFEGNDPTATKPVKIQIGGVIRTITSALSLTKVSWTSYLNLGSAELATKETDLFVYLRWDTGANAVCLDVSRIPYATRTGDFTQNDTGEKWYFVSSFAWSAVTDVEVNIWRFNATLSAGLAWSIPATSVIINRPIYETRVLQWGSQTGWTANNLLFYYKIRYDSLEFSFDANGTSNSTSSYITLPFSAKTIMAHDFALGLTYDNWVDLTTPWRADLYGATCNLYKNSAYWAWTASGAKIIRWQGHYYI